MTRLPSAESTDLHFTGVRRCSRCGIVVAHVVCGLFKPLPIFGTVTLQGNYRCASHIPSKAGKARAGKARAKAGTGRAR